jgi:hypothetical protein
VPIHDWTRVRSNRFHDFHQTWSVHLSAALNAGRLPAGYFAMLERKVGTREPDVSPIERKPPLPDTMDISPAIVGVPQTRVATDSSAGNYARRANRVTVRHPDGAVVAVIEIVSPGNKSSRDALRSFTRKAVEFLRGGVHLLIVDLFPPSRRDPQGIHKAIWDRIQDEDFTPPPDKPLTLVSYSAGPIITGYIEPVAVGDILPDMAVFLTPDVHILCPLEETYCTAWAQFPAPLKAPLEATPPQQT